MFSRLASAFVFLLQAIGTEENPGRAAYTRAMVLGYGYVYVNIDRYKNKRKNKIWPQSPSCQTLTMCSFCHQQVGREGRDEGAAEAAVRQAASGVLYSYM
jgi:hypothetical protein